MAVVRKMMPRREVARQVLLLSFLSLLLPPGGAQGGQGLQVGVLLEHLVEVQAAWLSRRPPPPTTASPQSRPPFSFAGNF